MNDRSAQEHLQALLKELRVEANLRQVDIAERLGVPQSYVSKYESGERRLDVIEVRRVCLALRVSFCDFASRLEEALK
jgi:transcriptional regulator with XRE-family HTH domain